MGRFSCFAFDSRRPQVWATLTRLGILGEYSDLERELIRLWTENGRRFDEEGAPGILSTRIVAYVEDLDTAGVHDCPMSPYISVTEGRLYGVVLLSYESGISVRIIARTHDAVPRLMLIFGERFSAARIHAIAGEFGISLATLDDPAISFGSTTLRSNDRSVGTVEVSIVPSS